MDKRYKSKGLTLVAPEVQGSSAEAIEEMVKEKKLSYTITKSITGPRLSNGIPHAAVFDVSGKMVYHGHPASPDFEKSIKTALKEAKPAEEKGTGSVFDKPKNLVESRTWTNADGNSLTAALISVSGDTGSFRKANGQTFSYAISKLSEGDREIISKASEPE
ncbi:MAG: hypothetical protein P8J87_17005 [Verrucomicrobiales bacterium]|nr:hypothetical protein [Verrucomicrobiales bacterium]